MLENKTRIGLAEAKSREQIISVNGVYLHSMHNPRKEAEVFASNHLAHLSRSPLCLVLGLGAGYHIDEISKILKLRHKRYQIAIIESQPELIGMFHRHFQLPDNTHVFHHEDPTRLFLSTELASFLVAKPVVIIHRPSYDTSPDWYGRFLSHRAIQDCSQWRIQNGPIKDFLNQNQNIKLAITQADQSQTAALLACYHEVIHGN